MPAVTHEHDLIDAIRQSLPDKGLALADDAFLNRETGQILTTDMLVAGRHFDLAYCLPADIGWKAAAVNVSDVAAMGGMPDCLLVSLALAPEQACFEFVKPLYEGLTAFCAEYNTRVVGGDTVSAPLTAINITATGILPVGHSAGLRSGARAGDLLVTTGFHGLSAMGLSALQQQQHGLAISKQRHLRPQPRVAQALQLSKTFNRYALMDSSDGLADALIQMATQSAVRFIVNADQLPCHPELAALADPLALMLYGGEDFELIAAVPDVTPEMAEHFSVIGRVEAGEPDVLLMRRDGTSEKLSMAKTYQHFQFQHNQLEKEVL